MLPPYATLKEVKEYLKFHSDKGANCPACDRFVKIYKRNLNAGIVVNLFGFMSADIKARGQYIHVYEMMKGGDSFFNMEYAKLGWWKFIEKMPHTEGVKKSSGFWRITEKGRSFTKNMSSVESTAHIYDDRVVGFSGEQVNIRTALGKKFDYQMLMGEI